MIFLKEGIMSYPNMNPGNPNDPVNHRSRDTAPMHRTSKRSNRNSRTVHKAADQMPSRPLAIPAIHMATLRQSVWISVR